MSKLLSVKTKLKPSFRRWSMACNVGSPWRYHKIFDLQLEKDGPKVVAMKKNVGLFDKEDVQMTLLTIAPHVFPSLSLMIGFNYSRVVALLSMIDALYVSFWCSWWKQDFYKGHAWPCILLLLFIWFILCLILWAQYSLWL